jgi:hypothetical protein
MVNAVGMPTTVAYVHVRFSVKMSIGLIFTFFRNILAEKKIQIDSLFEKESTDEITTNIEYD